MVQKVTKTTTEMTQKKQQNKANKIATKDTVTNNIKYPLRTRGAEGTVPHAGSRLIAVTAARSRSGNSMPMMRDQHKAKSSNKERQTFILELDNGVVEFLEARVLLEPRLPALQQIARAGDDALVALGIDAELVQLVQKVLFKHEAVHAQTAILDEHVEQLHTAKASASAMAGSIMFAYAEGEQLSFRGRRFEEALLDGAHHFLRALIVGLYVVNDLEVQLQIFRHERLERCPF